MGLLLLGYPVSSDQQIFSDGFECHLFTTCGTPAVQVFCGSGEIPDILSEEPIALEPEDMIHVLILPEGYRQEELVIFDQDVDDWMAEWEILDPYTIYKEAFCIWKWQLASKEHVSPGSPQLAETAFKVPISSNGENIDGDIPLTGPTAQRVWDVVNDFLYIPTAYYPPGGRTSKIAKNLVPVILVLDPAQGDSGFSGRARRLQNPGNENQRLSVAFAHDRAHEFSHALTRLQDEYIETDSTNLCVDSVIAIDSANVQNVVCQSSCPVLPWNHLLQGSVINPSSGQLEGAFGISPVGFHPELKCLMNGNHDNEEVFGGNGNLRVHDRFCNFCRELSVFRILERVRVLDNPATSYSTWVSNYRNSYYDQYGFAVPDPVPQENNLGEPIFQACTDDVAGEQVRSGRYQTGSVCDVTDPD